MIRLGTPHNAAELVITLCWVVAVMVWIVSALFIKRTVERSLGWARLLTLVAVIWVFEVVYRTGGLEQTLWSQTAAIGVLADLFTVAGLAVALWARAVLGRNWSGGIAFKEDHELIQHGPYAYVRHPIYSGFLLMGLGTAVESGRLVSFVLLVAAAVVLAVKAHLEERLMTSHFPKAYPDYRRRVKALIPGVW
jgi:protein-S-isoprenylcysteine O-methyltransferase Ste14